MSFGLYLVGYALFVGGVAYGLNLLHVPGHWMAIAIVIMIGLGIMSAVSKTKMRDPR